MIFSKMPLYLILLVSSLFANPMVAANSLIKPVCPAFPFFKPETGPLAVINCNFHTQYEKRIAQVIATFGAPGGRPIALAIGNTLVLKYNGKTETVIITPAPYHEIKAFSHLVFTLYLILSQSSAGKLNPKTIQALQQLQTQIENAIKDLPTMNLSDDAAKVALQLSNQTTQFIKTLLIHNQWTDIQLSDFYTQIASTLKDAMKIGTQAELNTLDEAINKWILPMNTMERQQIGIVVAAAHQARAEEISIQYFVKKFSKPQPKAGAKNENGLVILEGKFDETAALALLARHYLDREVGQVIFNDPARMQRDVMADTGSEWMNSL